MTQQSTPAPTLASELHALVINMPAKGYGLEHAADEAARIDYLTGHRDCRHAIAEALSAHPKVQAYERLVEAAQRLVDWHTISSVEYEEKYPGNKDEKADLVGAVSAALAAAERKP